MYITNLRLDPETDTVSAELRWKKNEELVMAATIQEILIEVYKREYDVENVHVRNGKPKIGVKKWQF